VEDNPFWQADCWFSDKKTSKLEYSASITQRPAWLHLEPVDSSSHLRKQFL
jgi:hypothetical protein